MEASVEHEEEPAVEYAGALKSTLYFVMKAFKN